MLRRSALPLRIGAAAGVAIGLAAILAASGWRAEHFRDGDFIQYWVAGRALLNGGDVYDPVTWRGLHDAIGSAGYEIAPGFGFLYPLPVALYALPVALLPLALAGPLWFVAQGMTALVALAALGRRLWTRAGPRDLLGLVALAVVIEPAYVIGNDGNIARFLPGIIGGSLALLLAGRPLSAGMLLGLAAVKPQLFLLFVPLVVVFCPAGLRVRLVAGGAATVAGSLLATIALRPGWIAEWLAQALRARVEYGRLNIWALLGGGPPWLVALIVTVAVVAIVWWWRAARPSVAQSAAAALGLSLGVAPYASDYDLVVLLVGVPVVLATIAAFPRAWRVALIIALVATSPVLAFVAAVTPIDHGLLFVPGIALTVLVIGTQLAASRLTGDADRSGAPRDPGLPGGSRAGAG